jgi:hypothetical protein
LHLSYTKKINLKIITCNQKFNSFVSGPYQWKACIFYEDELKTEQVLEYNPENEMKKADFNFENLDYGKIYNVCVATLAFNSRRWSSCGRDFDSAICRSVKTTCEPLKEPKDTPSQIFWSEAEDTFNPFTEIKIEMKKETFDGEKSGLSKFIIE